MISDKLAAAIAAKATAAGIEPAALLALVEVETNGQLFEADGHTPAFLFEKHVFYAELARGPADKLKAAVREGLAVPHWLGHVEYADENTSARRLAILARARVIDEERANRSASWGIGQTMGGGFASLGFASAIDMVRHMTEGGLAAQLECLIAEIKARSLVRPLNAHDWARVADRYNGAGYRANQYDTRLAAAWRRWSRKLASPAKADAPELGRAEIVATQRRLRDLGFAEVGKADGMVGSRTVGAISAFQHEEGLPVTGALDEATREALKGASPRIASPARANTTAVDLKDSRTVKSAQAAGTVASLKKWAGGVMVAGGGIAEFSPLETAQAAVDKASQAKSVLGQVVDLVGAPAQAVAHWLFGDPRVIVLGVLLVIAGIVIERHVAKIIAARVDDERAGVHAGAA